MRMRKKPNLDARMQRCGQYLIKTPEQMSGSWTQLMPHATELFLELGCGKGRFTVETAKHNPQALYIAVERVPDAMIIAMERAAQEELRNVFFVDGDAQLLTQYFAPDEVDRIYINFCDPWPSHKHAKRRLTHTNFLSIYHQVLRNGGELHFKTDNRDLYEYSLCQFPKVGYNLTQVTRNLHQAGICGVMTDYEEKFHEMGIRINRCVAVKTQLSQDSPPCTH